jgi:hypothetical protein
MDALWLVPPVVAQDASRVKPEAALLASHLASVRLRAGVAASAWQHAGHRNILLNPEDPVAVARVDFAAAPLCIVGKFFLDAEPAAWLDACARVKRSGGRLVLDICDYPFAEKPPAVTRFYAEALRQCDAVTVNSARMAELLAPHALQPPQVIEDAVLATPQRPEFAPGDLLELLWFGHPSNLRYLDRALGALAGYSEHQRCRLQVVTAPGYGVEQAVQGINARCAPRFEARFIPWSIEATRIALRQCDLVLIPGDPTDPLKSGVSSNRLGEALQAGRLPVASPLASYLPFGEAAWLGDDLVAGVEWAIANRGEVLARIRRGQALVSEKLAPAGIGRQWCTLFESLASYRPS